MSRKPRADSKLNALSFEQKEQLADLLSGGMNYEKAVEFCEKEFGVDTSVAAMSAFWHGYCSERIKLRRLAAVRVANEVGKAAEENEGVFDTATIENIKQMAFNLTMEPSVNTEDVSRIFKLVLAHRQQDLAERQLEQKAREYEQQIERVREATEKVKSKGGVTEETLAEIEEALNLL